MVKTGFISITDPQRIETIMRDYVFRPEQQRVSFIAVIHVKPGCTWNGRECKGGLGVEGARPMGISTVDGESSFTLTNSDSGYQRFIGTVKLSEITSLELLP